MPGTRTRPASCSTAPPESDQARRRTAPHGAVTHPSGLFLGQIVDAASLHVDHLTLGALDSAIGARVWRVLAVHGRAARCRAALTPSTGALGRWLRRWYITE